MLISWIDVAIIAFYLIFLISIGLINRHQAQDKNNYLLGGNSIPWYMLGLSNASGMFDISGTMWLVTITFVYGLKAVWIPWLWPVFNQIFLMIFLASWLRRSGVTTGAEWIEFRFGNDMGSKYSHIVVVVFAIISSIGFLAYGLIGLGKFIEVFVPWEYLQDYVGGLQVDQKYVPHLYGLFFTIFAVFYTIIGGMKSIVWADVIQFGIILVSTISIAIIAWNCNYSDKMVPEGWSSPFFTSQLDLDWSKTIPLVNQKIQEDGYSLFSIFFSMMLFKGVLISLAGPAPNYDMQKILSTKTPNEASKMSGFVSVALLPVRYLMIASFVVLAISNYEQLDLISGGNLDYEQILPSSMERFLPSGLLGLILAGFLAAFMSTFSGTLNAAQAYIVNDIYLKYYPSRKSNTKLLNYFSGLAIVTVSIIIGLFAGSINNILQWLVSGLWGSYAVANILKWYWWRFNSYGYFYSMAFGLVPALILPLFFTNTLDLYYFPWILLSSIIGALIGVYKYPSTDKEVLRKFFKVTKPWGFWDFKYGTKNFIRKGRFLKDSYLTIIGIVVQTSLVAAPIFLMIKMYNNLVTSLLIILIGGYLLYKYWWSRL